MPFLGSGIQNLIGKINPELILLKFTDFKYFRFTIWKESIESILRNPIFGTGAGSFPDIFLSETGFYSALDRISGREVNALEENIFRPYVVSREVINTFEENAGT